MGDLRSTLDAASSSVPRFSADVGLSREVVVEISRQKNEPDWMLRKRLDAFERFQSVSLPSWGPSLTSLDLQAITYFVRPEANESRSWDDVPSSIRTTFEQLGIPEAERASLSGVGAQFDSDVVYHNLKKEWEALGVVFLNMDEALRQHEDMVREYFMTQCVPVHDHPFAMLHAAVWSGGTFIYVPKGVTVDIPMQAYFRMNAERGGQFEHTLIIADEGSEVHYIEGCSAPKYSTRALHAGCVEIFVKRGARVKYSSIENWSKNTYNLNTKRAVVDEDGTIEWLNGNLGSGVTMLYPMSVLRGARARSSYLGVAFAGPGQVQDTGAKAALVAPGTSATIRAKSLSMGGGTSTYRGLVKVTPAAKRATVHVQCDALMLDGDSVSETIPVMSVDGADALVSHEAAVGRIGDQELGYLMSRGLTAEAARRCIVGGFLEPIVADLPLEYAIELEKLIDLEMEGSIA
ncbi:MAG: FeS assembly protein SufB [Candidatus Uhrbacteria bacterium GW2011_GWD2_52_7]|uniref:FeS assembly protein SufB n=1 Tax=Candidatus Uhrbacteria bacterium GW2011_GWD2_52_7 TaxID=1618989 RepID=A0A0G2AB68_9BACT|nr:MAG: FeS assembly protein SufB [Candidatus Uhrbacteria bacterium GW2011_GWD2_52_7]